MTRAACRLDVCCNDPDNGVFAGRAEQLQVTTWDGQDIEFEALRSPPRFTELPGAIRLCRRRWPILAAKEWYGNWCWNAYWLSPEILFDLLAIVHGARLFECVNGVDTLFEDWNGCVSLHRDLWAANLWGRHSIGSVA